MGPIKFDGCIVSPDTKYCPPEPVAMTPHAGDPGSARGRGSLRPLGAAGRTRPQIALLQLGTKLHESLFSDTGAC